MTRGIKVRLAMRKIRKKKKDFFIKIDFKGFVTTKLQNLSEKALCWP